MSGVSGANGQKLTKTQIHNPTQRLGRKEEESKAFKAIHLRTPKRGEGNQIERYFINTPGKSFWYSLLLLLENSELDFLKPRCTNNLKLQTAA